MRHVTALLAVASVFVFGAVVWATTPSPSTPQDWCRVTDLATGEEVTVPCHFDPAPTTTTLPATTTTTTTTTTLPATTTTTTTTTPPTTAPPTTEPPAGASFLETFDNNTGLDRFDLHVYQRNIDTHGWRGGSGGSWTGDHDFDCGGPDTQRTITWDAGDPDWGGGDTMEHRLDAVYTCRNHVMTAMGDVDGYSIVALSPAQTFDSVSEVSFSVNLTDLGNRQWWKVGVLSTSDCPQLDRACMYSDVSASDLPGDLATSGRLIASWGGGLSAGHPGGLKIGNTGTNGFVDAGADKATRHPVSLVDNGDGTVTFSVADVSRTVSGSFPDCPCRVVLYDHNYSPDKNEAGNGVQGYTWHWDDVQVS